jgi:hypothetical protein
MLDGNWTYRSYHNDTELVGDDAAKALALIFGEGVFSFEMVSPAALKGKLDMGGGYVLTLKGKVKKARGDCPLSLHTIGLGVAGTPTAGWRYDHYSWLAYTWPDGIDQIPALVGSVVRVKAHGPQSPAGVTSSFIAVKQETPA